MKTVMKLAIGLALLSAATGAEAQPLRPNILVVFDTSTSMLSGTGCPAGATSNRCDGSPACGNMGQDSRLFRLKEAIRATLQEVGTDEANLGLARFPQLDTPGTDRGCFRGRYINSADGCRTSSADQSDTAPWSWFDSNLREFVVVDVTRPFTPATGPSAADFDPAGANVTEIHRWLDNVETVAGAAFTNPEIRSGGQGTPLAASLLYSRIYFDKYIKPRDPKGSCRKNIVILVTDGREECMGDPVARAQQLAGSNVRLYVVVQTGEGGTAHDQMAAAGGTGQAIRVDFTNPTATKAALINIIAESVPPSEICNAIDDNCNGQIDELPLPGVGNQCLCPGLMESHVGKGMCKKGVTVCTNGGIQCVGCVLPTAELCNGLDDNCNGEVDEGFDLGKQCDNGLQGACLRKGSTVCKPDGTGVFCDAAPVTGSPEICNNVDDDCDGRVDNGPLPGENEACGADLGVCKAGKTKCENGRFVCIGEQLPGVKEICNAQDDNCNGIVDEMIDGIGMSCSNCPGLDPAKIGVGECKPGKLVCKGREPLDCEGCVGPVNEVCDCKDNNCNGMSDEGDPCGGGRVCVKGADKCTCEIPCKNDEFPCPPGYACDRANTPPICRSLKCATVICEPGWQCDEGTGKCRDLCENVMCPAPQTCSNGRCIDCRLTGCGAGYVCVDQKCERHPCANKTCGANEYCDEDGACVPLCTPPCARSERCVRGKCEMDKCAAVSCGASQVCNPETGACVTNQCLVSGGSCPGQTCVPTTGMCKDDPCARLTCPNCYACEMTADGVGACFAVDDCLARQTRVVAKGGGCACAVPGAAGTGPGALGVLVIAFGLLVVRRRRHPRL